MKKQKNTTILWFVAGCVAVLLTAPNGTIMKSAMEVIGPELLNSLRYGLIALLLLPVVIAARRKMNNKNIKYALLMGVCLAVGVTSHAMALDRSQASYVAIVELLMPIIFVFYSFVLMKEKIRRRAVAGISLAALGALVVVIGPLAFASQPERLEIDPIATILILTNCLVFPLSLIFSRKSHEAGLPLFPIFGISACVVFLVSFGAAILWADWGQLPLAVGSSDVILAILYSALVVALIARMMNVAVYQRIGSAAQGGLSYAESILAIIIPILVLGEQLSIEIVAGMALILTGLYVLESHHKWKHRKHLHKHGLTHR